MRNILLIIALILGNLKLAAQDQMHSKQIKVNKETNCQIRYLYYPNLSAYYDKINEEFIFQEKGAWIKSKELPNLYGGYSTFNKICVEIMDYEEDEPQSQLKIHKKIFPYNSKGRFTYSTAKKNK